jgi:hypothetical protein
MVLFGKLNHIIQVGTFLGLVKDDDVFAVLDGSL